MKAKHAWLGALACWCGLEIGAAEFWVSPTGDDRAAGTQAEPLATVAMAQRKARELRRLASLPVRASDGSGRSDPSDASDRSDRSDPSDKSDPVRIVLRGGTYALSEPLRFRWEDSGTAASPTIVESAPGERAVLSGGVQVTGWKKPAAAEPRLTPTARDRVWVADAPRVGGRVLEFRQLWAANRKATRARHPNGNEMSRLSGWDRAARVATLPAASLGALANPGRVAGLELFVQQQWEIGILRVRTLERNGDAVRVTFHEPESRIEFEHPWPQPILPPQGGGAFVLVNALELLDEPGEWYQELPGGRVFYWPRDGEDLSRDAVMAPAFETLLRVEGTLDRPVAHVQFKNIGFAHTTWMRPSQAGHVPLQAGMHLLDAYGLKQPGTPDWHKLENQAWIGRMPAGVVVAGGAVGVRFERCRFEHLAASGLDLGTGTRDSVVEGNVYRDVGGNAVQLGSFQEGGVETHVPYDPADEREACARVRIANNYFDDTANEDWGCVAILAGYVRDTTIEHNEITNTSYTGISVGWGWTRTLNAMRNNRVRANLMHRIATRMCDTAGVYTLSAQPGTVISENVVRDITMSPYVDRPDHWFYYYTDEGSSWMTVRDNWCPEERFLKNANGPGVIWENNGPMVSDEIKNAAGLEPQWRTIKE